MSDEVETPPILSWTRYHPFTGAVLSNFDATAEEASYNTPVVEGRYDWRTHYLPEGIPTPRPSMPLVYDSLTIEADGLSQLSIGGVPEGTTVRLYGPMSMEGITEDISPINFCFAVEGKYTLILKNFPYLEERLEINAT